MIRIAQLDRAWQQIACDNHQLRSLRCRQLKQRPVGGKLAMQVGSVYQAHTNLGVGQMRIIIACASVFWGDYM
ncbi:MAG: hypothetical protein U0Z44_06340 [Kouleothrix sp.]